MPKHFLSMSDLTSDEIRAIVSRAAELKARAPSDALSGRTLALLFEKPSLRTRGSFEVGIHQLGGHCFYTGGAEVGLGVREPVSDVAKVMSRYVDGIVARVNSHASLAGFARHATVPVVNALSDWEHPCQALADLLTIFEFAGAAKGAGVAENTEIAAAGATGSLEGVVVAFVGDGNNVARSLAQAVCSVGGKIVIASPEGYQLDRASLDAAAQRARELETPPPVVVTDPVEAVTGADVVYTDVWVSMGDEAERAKRLASFRGYTVGPALLAKANPGAVFMHDMPAHYGEEVPPGMLDHPQSVAFDQAENRLHAQKALLEFLFQAG